MKLRTIPEWTEEIKKTSDEILALAFGLDTSVYQDHTIKGWLKRNTVKIVVYGLWVVMLILAIIFKWEGTLVIIGIIFAMKWISGSYNWLKLQWQKRHSQKNLKN